MSGDGAGKIPIKQDCDLRNRPRVQYRQGCDPRNRPRIQYRVCGDLEVDPGTAFHYNMITAPVYKEE